MGSRLYFISAPPSSIISPSEPESGRGRVGGNINLPSPAMLLCPSPHQSIITTLWPLTTVQARMTPGAGAMGWPGHKPHYQSGRQSSPRRSAQWSTRRGRGSLTLTPGSPGTPSVRGRAPSSLMTSVMLLLACWPQSSDAFFLGIDLRFLYCFLLWFSFAAPYLFHFYCRRNKFQILSFCEDCTSLLKM